MSGVFPTSDRISIALLALLSLFARSGIAYSNTCCFVSAVPSARRGAAAAVATPLYSSSSSSSSSEASSTAAISSLYRKGKVGEESTIDRSSFQGVNGEVFQEQGKYDAAKNGDLSPLQSALTLGMLAFIVGMCIALPATLLPQKLLLQLGLVDRIQSERNALSTGRFCARWLLRLIPFAKLETIVTETPNPNPEPAVWVCNHQSMLDVFFLMAADGKLRGKNKRPMKIIYWQGLEDNPVTKLLFQQCGFIPVAMAASMTNSPCSRIS